MINFDTYIPREGTSCVKYDLRYQVFGTEDVIPLWVADMDFATPDFILDAMHQRLNHPILGYSFRGQDFNESLARWLLRQHSLQIDPEIISFSPGVVTGLMVLLLAFTEPGDKIIVQPPIYPPFFEVPLAHHRVVVYNPLVFDGNRYVMDFDDLSIKATDAKMLILSNPHNPVGRVWEKWELEKLSEICLKNDVMIISDEIHSDIIYPGFHHTPFLSLDPKLTNNSVSCFAPSKTFNLAGLSTSAILIPNSEKRRIYNSTLERYHLQMGNIMGNIAFEAAYNQGEEWLKELLAYLHQSVMIASDYIAKHLKPIHLVQPEATYLLWLDFRDFNLPTDELYSLLIHQAHLGLNRGEEFGIEGKGFMRMNIACPHAVLEKALHNLRNIL
ncbi:MAG: aminotransferase class I and II [Bacteroidetes bacterium 38_7]|nr:MAG: aminotransferase class I and II [Bacteroidetes bacterium 38_7]